MTYKKDIRRVFGYLKTTQAVLSGTILISGTLLFSGIAHAAAAGSSVTNGASDTSVTTSKSTKTTAAEQTRVALIISKGNQEIERRLTTLSTLNTKITAATHLTSGDQSALSTEVSSTISGLTSLKTQLDAATTVSGAHTDAEDIYTEYRVYALVAPKVGLIKVADDQQVVQNKLTALSGKLQARITADQQAGKSVTTLQTELTSMNSEITAANQISSNIETSVITLQPSDYDSNHAVLSGDNTQLKTAHTDDQTAYSDAKSIVSGLEAL